MDSETYLALARVCKWIQKTGVNHPVQQVRDECRSIVRRARFTAAHIEAAEAIFNDDGRQPAERLAALREVGDYILLSGVLRRSG